MGARVGGSDVAFGDLAVDWWKRSAIYKYRVS